MTWRADSLLWHLASMALFHSFFNYLGLFHVTFEPFSGKSAPIFPTTLVWRCFFRSGEIPQKHWVMKPPRNQQVISHTSDEREKGQARSSEKIVSIIWRRPRTNSFNHVYGSSVTLRRVIVNWNVTHLSPHVHSVIVRNFLRNFSATGNVHSPGMCEMSTCADRF